MRFDELVDAIASSRGDRRELSAAFGLLLRGEELAGRGAEDDDRQNGDEHERVKGVAAQAAWLTPARVGQAERHGACEQVGDDHRHHLVQQLLHHERPADLTDAVQGRREREEDRVGEPEQPPGNERRSTASRGDADDQRFQQPDDVHARMHRSGECREQGGHDAVPWAE